MKLTTPIALALLATAFASSCSSASAQGGSSSRKPAGDVRVDARIDEDGKKDEDDKKKKDDEDDKNDEQPLKPDDGDGGRDDAASDDCYKGTDEICAIEKAIHQIANQERAQRGMEAFEFSAKVSFVARAWSEDQARRGRIGHDGWPRDRERLYSEEFSERMRSSAENVAMTSGASAEQIAREFMNMWMRSPGHRANILGRSNGLGVGIARRGGEWYGTQLFTFD